MPIMAIVLNSCKNTYNQNNCPKHGLNVSSAFITFHGNIPLPTRSHTTSGSHLHPPFYCRHKRLFHQSPFATGMEQLQCLQQGVLAACQGYFRLAGHKGLASWGQARKRSEKQQIPTILKEIQLGIHKRIKIISIIAIITIIRFVIRFKS